MTLTRRGILAAGVLLVAALLRWSRAEAASKTVTFMAATRSIAVHGRAATFFGITQADATHSIQLPAGGDFDVRLANAMREEVLIHWL